MDKAQAISILRPGSEFNIRDGAIEWLDTTQTPPTENDITACIAAYSYRDLRTKAYPPIGDQLDALWKGGQAKADMLILVEAIKTKYPKGQP